MANTAVDTRPTLLARLLDPQPDPSSWDEFVRCYRDQIHSWCRAWGLQDTDAEDVTQSVLVRLLRKLRRFRYGPGTFKVDWALDGPIPWKNAECARSATVHVGGTLVRTQQQRMSDSVADATLFLARSAAARITGQTLRIS